MKTFSIKTGKQAIEVLEELSTSEKVESIILVLPNSERIKIVTTPLNPLVLSKLFMGLVRKASKNKPNSQGKIKCPICEQKISYYTASNNHIHVGCEKCGISVCQ